jgi:hypothetical protein
MSDKVLPGAGAAIATMLSTPEGATKIEAAFAELDQRLAAITREAALAAAMSSLVSGGIAAADGDSEAAREHFAAADRWTAVAKQAGA